MLLKFPGRHPRSPCSSTLKPQPQSLPVYCLIRKVEVEIWYSMFPCFCGLNSAQFQNASSGYPRKSFLFHLKFCCGEAWMFCMFLWVFCTPSSPAGINLSCSSEPSSCHTPRNPWGLCHAQIKIPVNFVWSQPETPKELLNQPWGFWK